MRMLLGNDAVAAQLTLVLGGFIWAGTTIYSFGTADHSGCARAGTILIATGVFALMLARRYSERAAKDFGDYISLYQNFNGLMSSPTDLPDPFTDQERAEISRLNQYLFEGGGYERFLSWKRGHFRWELMTIVLGTLQSGYGDLISKLLDWRLA